MQPMVVDWSWIGHEGEGEDFQVVGSRNLRGDGPFAMVKLGLITSLKEKHWVSCSIGGGGWERSYLSAVHRETAGEATPSPSVMEGVQGMWLHVVEKPFHIMHLKSKNLFSNSNLNLQKLMQFLLQHLMKTDQAK